MQDTEDHPRTETDAVERPATAATVASHVGNGSGKGLFVDTSKECAICLQPFDFEKDRNRGDGDGDGNGDGNGIVELSCGHLWHAECLRNQIRHARPDPLKRLVLTGCRCAKCGTVCDGDGYGWMKESESDHAVVGTLARLQKQVDGLIREQLLVEGPHGHDNEEISAARIEEGRRKYAFYLCASCDEPFFGGTIECGAAGAGADADYELPRNANERTCPSCRPQSRSVCRDPVRHRAHFVWKCRTCCRPATRVCYGTVHFCDGCHTRNDRAVQNAQRQRRSDGPGHGRPLLDAVPCPGGEACPYPKPLLHFPTTTTATTTTTTTTTAHQQQHSNGHSPECEQVYYCARCESRSSRHPDDDRVHGSRNLMVNPCGCEMTTTGWRQHGHEPWRVEQTPEAFATAQVTTNFVSGPRWCVMSQVVPLHRLLLPPRSHTRHNEEEEVDAPPVVVEVSARYMGRTDCPSVFVLSATVRDATGHMLWRDQTGPLDTPCDAWETATLTHRFSLTAGQGRGRSQGERPHDLVVTLAGKDARFWAGSYGAKVTDCSVRILGTEEELSRILTEEGRNRVRRAGEGNNPLHRFDLYLAWALLFTILGAAVKVFMESG